MQWSRIFKRKGFFFAIIIQLFAFFYPHLSTGLVWPNPFVFFENLDIIYNFTLSATLGLCSLFLPFVAVLPSAILVAEDFESNFIHLLLQRTGKTKYLVTRTMQTIFGASFASIIGTLIFAGIVLIFSPLQGDSAGWRESLLMGSFAPLAKHWFGIPYIIETAIRFAFAAATWALVGLAIGTLSKKQSIALVLSLLFHFSLSYYMESNPFLFHWSPSIIQSPYEATTTPLSTFYFQQGAYFLVFILFSTMSLHYRLKEIQ